MEFGFSEDQLLLQTTVRDFLSGECTPDWIRAQWETETGRSPAFWAQLAELGLPGLLVPEAQGGLGMDETDLVLLMEEIGRVGLAEPLTGTAVGLGLLRALADVRWRTSGSRRSRPARPGWRWGCPRGPPRARPGSRGSAARRPPRAARRRRARW